MKMNWSLKLVAAFAVLALGMTSCKKNDKVVTPPAQAHFANQTSGTYFVTGPTITYKVPIGVTTVSSSDRTVKVTITSPTGAAQGVQYTAPTTIVIPANKALDSLEIKAVYTQYTAGRKDTLIITLQDQDVPASSYNSKFTLLVRGACFEGDVNLPDLLGDYNNTNEDFGGSPYGPYTTSITSVTPLTATTGKIVVTNIFDAGWNPITFTLDWTDPANRKATLVQQSGIGDAGTISTTYAGQDITVRPHSNGQIGTFSICHQTIQLKMQLGVTGLGFFGQLYVVNMAR